MQGNEEACGTLPGDYLTVQDLQVGVAADAGRCSCYGGCTNQTLKPTQNVIQAAMKIGYADDGWTATRSAPGRRRRLPGHPLT